VQKRTPSDCFLPIFPTRKSQKQRLNEGSGNSYINRESPANYFDFYHIIFTSARYAAMRSSNTLLLVTKRDFPFDKMGNLPSDIGKHIFFKKNKFGEALTTEERNDKCRYSNKNSLRLERTDWPYR